MSAGSRAFGGRDKPCREIPIDTGKLKTYTKEKIVTGSNGEKYEANHS